MRSKDARTTGRLILSRKVGEKIMIGDDIEVMLVEIDRNKVRLGIKAPKHVTVNRLEIHDRIKEGVPR